MKSYLKVIENILEKGVKKPPARPFLPSTLGVSFAHIQHDLKEGFPLLTTKKMFWKGIVHELIWFLKGGTNIKYLVDNKTNIWNDDAYRWYLTYAELNLEEINNILHKNEDGSYRVLSKEEFIKKIFITSFENLPEVTILNKELPVYKLGDLGKVYGYQWRNQNGVDQIADIFENLENNPFSRYNIIDGWNKADFDQMALPPCHLLYQFICRPLTDIERINLYDNCNNSPLKNRTLKRSLGTFKYPENYISTHEEDIPDPIGWFLSEEEHNYLDNEGIPRIGLDLNMYQRSCDSALGLPYNIASMSLLLIMVAKVKKMDPGVVNWIGGDTHLYENHLKQAKEQIKRKPYKLPTLKINKEINSLDDIISLSIDDFELINYESHEKIPYILSVGLS